MLARLSAFTCGFAAAIIAAAASVSAQRPATAHDPAAFRGGVDLVTLDVCVKGRDGSSGLELKPQDFLVLENNIPQRISLFSAEGHVPLAVSLLIDNSQSMSGARLDRAQAAAASLVDLLRPDDLVETITFNSHPEIRYRLGPDRNTARASVRGIAAGGLTALYEAVLVALRNQQHALRGGVDQYRRVLIVLTDGENTAGSVTFDEVLDEVHRGGALVYVVSLRTDKDDAATAPLWEMSRLAHDTGGVAVAVHDLENLTPIYQDIGRELLHLYRLGYVPAPLTSDGSWRNIAVRVSSGDLVVRTRTGYYAPQR